MRQPNDQLYRFIGAITYTNVYPLRIYVYYLAILAF
jgi:hypothetical protein